MGLLKKKDKNIDMKVDEKGNPIPEEEMEEGIGSKILLVLVTFFIVLIWLGIIIILIKFDVGGFGSTILRPIIKDVPYVNMILPEQEEVESAEYQFESMGDAVDRIKELEQQLNAALESNSVAADEKEQMRIQIVELQKYKEEQDEFEKTKEKFYEEVVFSNSAPDLEAYKTFYESIDPENAEVLYKQVVEQLEYDAMVEDYAKTYSSMKAKQAAAIFDTMTDDFELVADILQNMSVASRADILGKMEPENAAKLTAIMEPNNK